MKTCATCFFFMPPERADRMEGAEKEDCIAYYARCGAKMSKPVTNRVTGAVKSPEAKRFCDNERNGMWPFNCGRSARWWRPKA